MTNALLLHHLWMISSESTTVWACRDLNSVPDRISTFKAFEGEEDTAVRYILSFPPKYWTSAATEASIFLCRVDQELSLALASGPAGVSPSDISDGCSHKALLFLSVWCYQCNIALVRVSLRQKRPHNNRAAFIGLAFAAFAGPSLISCLDLIGSAGGALRSVLSEYLRHESLSDLCPPTAFAFRDGDPENTGEGCESESGCWVWGWQEKPGFKGFRLVSPRDQLTCE